MSTRCQIAFVTLRGDARDERWVYRHWDGYPEAVLPDLRAFIAWNAGRMSDVEYCAANFLFWSKFQLCDAAQDSPLDGSSVPRQLLGFGVCKPGEFHGDIEYFYEVITDQHGTRVLAYEVDPSQEVTRASLRLRDCERHPP